jgi:hypothetical protein
MNAPSRFMLALIGIVTLLGCIEKGVSPDLGIFEDVSRRVLKTG